MSSGLLSPGFPSPKRATDVGGRPKMSPTLALIVKKFSDGSGRRVKVAAAAAAAAAGVVVVVVVLALSQSLYHQRQLFAILDLGTLYFHHAPESQCRRNGSRWKTATWTAHVSSFIFTLFSWGLQMGT